MSIELHPRPTPLDWGPDFCDLKWKPPRDDGGSPITGYIIEIRDKSRRQWKEALKTNATTLQGKIEAPLIVEGNDYEFRYAYLFVYFSEDEFCAQFRMLLL